MELFSIPKGLHCCRNVHPEVEVQTGNCQRTVKSHFYIWEMFERFASIAEGAGCKGNNMTQSGMLSNALAILN